jgi:hypothetical protein
MAGSRHPSGHYLHHTHLFTPAFDIWDWSHCANPKCGHPELELLPYGPRCGTYKQPARQFWSGGHPPSFAAYAPKGTQAGNDDLVRAAVLGRHRAWNAKLDTSVGDNTSRRKACGTNMERPAGSSLHLQHVPGGLRQYGESSLQSSRLINRAPDAATRSVASIELTSVLELAGKSLPAVSSEQK